MNICDYDSAVAYLMGRINYEQTPQIPYRSREFKLRRMERLLNLVDDPHHRLPAVHLAGTKGKGSTAAMVESILRAAGYRTGLYTSPHLQRIEERFSLAGKPCGEDLFVQAAQRVAAAVHTLDQDAQSNGGTGPTFFEITTAIAMLIFAEQRVDVAVLEVGLGGRLDSTNTCRPLVSVITSISFDHTKQLGNTLTSIAREKAGIIKPGVPVICGAGKEEAATVVRKVAHQRRCSLRELDVDFHVEVSSGSELSKPAAYDSIAFTYCERHEHGQKVIADLRLAMLGHHQLANAALAIASVRQLVNSGYSVGDEAIRRGLAAAVCPARVELISERPAIILDAAHNVASCRALAEVIDEHFAHVHDRTLILATSYDKDAGGMLRALLPHFRRVFFTRFSKSSRSADPAELLRHARTILGEPDFNPSGEAPPELSIAPSAAEALSQLLQHTNDDSFLCVAGSFFLAGEVRPFLQQSLRAATRGTAETAFEIER